MTTTLKVLGTFLATFFAFNALGQKSLVGEYSSNFAAGGFFISKIQLNADSTFKYEFRGDMIKYVGTGKYTFEKHIVYLKFDPLKYDSAWQRLQDTTFRPNGNRLLYRKKRLYKIQDKGRPLGKTLGGSKHRKYLIFGDRFWTKRRIFMEKKVG